MKGATEYRIVVAMSIIVAIIAIVELVIAMFQLESPAWLIRKAMWLGFILFVGYTLLFLINTSKKHQGKVAIWFLPIFILSAVVSFLGLYVPFFVPFALWVNAIWWVFSLFLMMCLSWLKDTR